MQGNGLEMGQFGSESNGSKHEKLKTMKCSIQYTENPQNSKYTHKTQNTPKVIVYLVNGQTQLILPNQAQTHTKHPLNY